MVARRARARAAPRADANRMAHFEFPVLEIAKVVDGDTVDAILDLGFGIRIKQRLRLIGIDTPEIASKDAVEKERARAAREFTKAWCGRQATIRARTTKEEKYGRYLAELVGDDGALLTAELVAATLARRYTP